MFIRRLTGTRRSFPLRLALLLLGVLVLLPGTPAIFAQDEPAADAAPAVPVDPLASARIWAPVSLDAPLSMGAVDAHDAPGRAASAGVAWQRVLFDWSHFQHGGPTDWSPGWETQQGLALEKAAGRPVVGALISTPSWASGSSDAKAPPLGLDLPVTDPRNVWATWVRTVVSQYIGVVDTWVIGNEPDVWSDTGHARQWTGTVQQYERMLQVAYVVAKSANPRATVLMAGMTYWWDASVGQEQYFSRVLKVAAADPSAPGAGWYFDGAVLQLYNNPRGLFEAPRLFHQIMQSYGFDKPIWINETNVVPWNDPSLPLTRDFYRATLDEQASYLVQAAAYALAAGIDKLEVFKMMDDPHLQPGRDQAFGMVRADASLSPRPILTTFGVVAREMGPTTRAQLVDDGSADVVYLEQPVLGRRLTVVWNTTGQPVELSLPALGSSAEGMDKVGNTIDLTVDDAGDIPLELPAATDNTLPGNPTGYFVGGDPLLISEPLPAGYQPLTPTAGTS